MRPQAGLESLSPHACFIIPFALQMAFLCIVSGTWPQMSQANAEVSLIQWTVMADQHL
jgi:hypothetical protein